MRILSRFALALVLATGVAACGDDDDTSEAVVDDALSDDGGGGDSSSDDDDSGGDGGGDEFTTPEGCVEFAQEFAEASASITSAFTGGGTGDFNELANFFDDVAEDVGGEVGDALRVLGDAYAEFAAALEDSGADLSDPNSFQDPEVAAALTEASEAFNAPEVQAASETIEEFTANNCEA